MIVFLKNYIAIALNQLAESSCSVEKKHIEANSGYPVVGIMISWILTLVQSYISTIVHEMEKK